MPSAKVAIAFQVDQVERCRSRLIRLTGHGARQHRFGELYRANRSDRGITQHLVDQPEWAAEAQAKTFEVESCDGLRLRYRSRRPTHQALLERIGKGEAQARIAKQLAFA